MHQQLLNQQKHRAALRSRLQADAQRAKQEQLRRIEPVAKARARSRGLASLGLDPEIMSLSEKFGKMSQLVDEVQQQMEAQYGLTHLDATYMPGDAAAMGMIDSSRYSTSVQQQQADPIQLQQRQQLKLQQLLQDGQQAASSVSAPGPSSVLLKKQGPLQLNGSQQRQAEQQQHWPRNPAPHSHGVEPPQHPSPSWQGWQQQRQQRMQQGRAGYAAQQPSPAPTAPAAAGLQGVEARPNKQQLQGRWQPAQPQMPYDAVPQRPAQPPAANSVQPRHDHTAYQQQQPQTSDPTSSITQHVQVLNQAPALQQHQQQWQQPLPQQVPTDQPVQPGQLLY